MTLPLRFATPLEETDRARLRWRRQWLVVPAARPGPDGFLRVALTADWMLWHHEDLRLQWIPRPGGGVAVLGLAFDPERPGDSIEGRFQSADPAALATEVTPLAGTYVVIGAGPGGVRLYTDPASLMPVFYDGSSAVASTPLLLPGAQRDDEVDRSYRLRGSDDWYPGALVPYRGVRALLANHELDLGSGRTTRFWPHADVAPVSHAAGVARAAELVRGTAEGVLRAGPTLVSLTGGRDSRVVLAACRDRASELETFTIRAPHVKPCDVEAPLALAERFGLNHRVVEAGVAPDWIVELYDELGSELAVGAGRRILDGCRQVAGQRYTHLNGNLGALAKSYFWGSRDPGPVRSDVILRELIQRPETVRAAVDEWIATLPELRPTTAYNLMYLEQRGARYMGIRENASSLFYASATVFSSRQLFEAICSLPREVQFGGQLLVELVEQLWPELLEVPYCAVTRSWGMYVPKRVKGWLYPLVRARHALQQRLRG